MIASGDHIFAQAVTGLAAAGYQVTVASRRGRLSQALQHVANGRVIYLDPPGHPATRQDAA